MKLPQSNFDQINDLYNSNRVFRSAPHSLWATTHSSCNVLLHFIFRYLKCGMKVSFLSNIIPRNLYSSTTGISTPSSFRLESLCNFFWTKMDTFCYCFRELETILLLPTCWFSLVLVAVFIHLCGYILICNISWGHAHIVTHRFRMATPRLYHLSLYWTGLQIIYCSVGYPLPDFLHLKMWYQPKLWIFY